MRAQLKTFIFALTLSSALNLYAGDYPSVWTPGKYFLGAFYVAMATIGKPDLGAIWYRCAFLSPLAFMTAGGITVTYGATRWLLKHNTQSSPFS
jgi:hypothetical protein